MGYFKNMTINATTVNIYGGWEPECDADDALLAAAEAMRDDCEDCAVEACEAQEHIDRRTRALGAARALQARNAGCVDCPSPHATYGGMRCADCYDARHRARMARGRVEAEADAARTAAERYWGSPASMHTDIGAARGAQAQNAQTPRTVMGCGTAEGQTLVEVNPGVWVPAAVAQLIDAERRDMDRGD